jgi:3-methyladenine DNA glycosylase/8-oxoguanine DNA glycosylase
MADLVALHGPMLVGRRPAVDCRFEQLAESIAYQQLAGQAAATIWGRVRGQYGPGPLDPADVAATPEESLRAAGLSSAKVAALLDLARHVDDGTLLLDRAGRLPDEVVIDQLVQVRGIGRWTAQMFLLFTLQRLDVWPAGDYGVRMGYGRAYGLAEAPTERELAGRGERFRPYRSVAAWYCWRSADSPGRSAN